MWKWLKPRRPVAEPVLGGAPAKMRVKTYSAETGYVYQYVYRGYRNAAESTEFVFNVTRDRRNYFDVKIVLLDSAIGERSSTERYAVAKMTLFRSFDELTEIGQFEAAIVPDAGQVEDALRLLDRL